MQVEGAAPGALLLHPDRARLKGPGMLQVPPLSDLVPGTCGAALRSGSAMAAGGDFCTVPDQVRRL